MTYRRDVIEVAMLRCLRVIADAVAPDAEIPPDVTDMDGGHIDDIVSFYQLEQKMMRERQRNKGR